MTEMKVMSSQHFRDCEIINDKIEELQESGTTKIIIPVINAHVEDLEGNTMFIAIDKHHTMSAAIELGIEIEFEEVEDPICSDGYSGEEICRAWYMDGDWYYIDTEEEDGIGELVW